MVVTVLKTVIRLYHRMIDIKIAVLVLMFFYFIDQGFHFGLQPIIRILCEDIRCALHPFGNVGIPKIMRARFIAALRIIEIKGAKPARLFIAVLYRPHSDLAVDLLALRPETRSNVDLIQRNLFQMFQSSRLLSRII